MSLQIFANFTPFDPLLAQQRSPGFLDTAAELNHVFRIGLIQPPA